MAIKKLFNIDKITENIDIDHWHKTNETIEYIDTLGFNNGTNLDNINNQKSGTFIVSAKNKKITTSDSGKQIISQIDNNLEVPIKNVVTTDGDQIISGNKTFTGDVTLSSIKGVGKNNDEIEGFDKIVDKYGFQRKISGMDGEIIYHDGNEIFPQFLMNEGWVCETEEDLAKCMNHKPSFYDIFNSWPRFRIYLGENYKDQDRLVDLGVLPSTTTENRPPLWEYNKEHQTICQTTNSTEYVGFLSPKKYSYYDNTIRLFSNRGDDDTISLVAAYFRDENGKSHTLSFIRSCGNVGSNWSCVVDYCRFSTSNISGTNVHGTKYNQFMLENRSDVAPNPVTGTKDSTVSLQVWDDVNKTTRTKKSDGTDATITYTYGWVSNSESNPMPFSQEEYNSGKDYFLIKSGEFKDKYAHGFRSRYPNGYVSNYDIRNGSIVRMIREGNVFTAYCSQFGSSQVDYGTKIEIDLDKLVDQYPILKGFMGSSQWGYSNFSQENSMYENIKIVDMNEYIYDLVHWKVLQFKNSLWTETDLDPLDTLGRGRLSYNNITQKLFYTNTNEFVHLDSGTLIRETTPAGDTIINNNITYNTDIPVGTIVMWSQNSLPEGYLLCDGSAVSRSTYGNLYKVISTKYGAGNGSTTFNLPNFDGRFPQGSSSSGSYIGPGLPNITGVLDAKTESGIYSASGALQNSTTNGKKGHGDTMRNSTNLYIDFNASKSNSIYGASSTVQPPAITIRFVIKY